MLINLSNHPSSVWKNEQINAALEYGKIIDIPFPQIPPEWDSTQVSEKAREHFDICLETIGDEFESSAIHLAGEPVFCFFLLQYLLKEGIICLSSTTERIVTVKDSGIKESAFKFIRFRKYQLI